MQSRAAHALLALAMAGQGVAIVPSVLRPERLGLDAMAVTHQAKPLRIALAVLWDRRRTLPRFALGFADLLAGHIHETFGGSGHRRAKRASGRPSWPASAEP